MAIAMFRIHRGRQSVSWGLERLQIRRTGEHIKIVEWADILSGAFRESQPFSGIDNKRPISAAVTGTGNSTVFRHAVPVPDSYTFSRNAASSCVSRQLRS